MSIATSKEFYSIYSNSKNDSFLNDETFLLKLESAIINKDGYAIMDLLKDTSEQQNSIDYKAYIETCQEFKIIPIPEKKYYAKKLFETSNKTLEKEHETNIDINTLSKKLKDNPNNETLFEALDYIAMNHDVESLKFTKDNEKELLDILGKLELNGYNFLNLVESAKRKIARDVSEFNSMGIETSHDNKNTKTFDTTSEITSENELDHLNSNIDSTNDR